MTAVALALVVVAEIVSPPAVSGFATYYDAPSGAFAAGPALRRSLGPDWRGSRVRVEVGDGRYVVGTLSDWCACGKRHGVDTVLDLPKVDFATIASLSQGIVRVTVTKLGGAIKPPPTDTELLEPTRPRGAMQPA